MPLPQAGCCPPFSRAHTREAQCTARSEPQAGGSQAASAGGSAPSPEVSVAPSGQRGPGPLTPAGWGERSSATAQTAFQKCHPSCLVCETEGSSTADAARGALWDGKGCVCVRWRREVCVCDMCVGCVGWMYGVCMYVCDVCLRRVWCVWWRYVVCVCVMCVHGVYGM